MKTVLRSLLFAAAVLAVAGCGDAGVVTDDSTSRGVDARVCEKGQVRACVSELGGCYRQACLGGSQGWGACEAVGPGEETCGNRFDDDCDGQVDEGCSTCVPGMPCVTSCGSTGAQSCAGVSEFGDCVPPEEVCGNGADEDCDGHADEDCQECEVGQVRLCTSRCGTQGKQVCDASGRYDPCAPPAEVCDNGVDDDCDGAVDEGCQACAPGAVRQCTTGCGSTGWQTCTGVGEFETVCHAPKEDCLNGKDDDCDGEADDDDSECVNCTETDAHNCNGDMGYGDHCAPSDNTGGCSAERFWAWCNRRNEAYPNIWDDYLSGWVDERCDGTVELTDEQYAYFHCADSSGKTYLCQTPLVLAFHPSTAVTFAQAGHGFRLDPALPTRTDWPTAATPWLALDRDGNGRIDSGAELFGSSTVLPGGGRARNGFEALAALDGNRDGRIDREDPVFAELVLWADADADGLSQPRELRTLAQAGVVSLALGHEVRPRCDARGNCERERAGFAWTDAAGEARAGAVIDVWLRAWPEPAVVASAHLDHQTRVCR